MCVSFAEESDCVVGIDPSARFSEVGDRLAREKGVTNVSFASADGTALPFKSASFDFVLSHAVIEHVADPAAHLQRLKPPVPLHLLVGRKKVDDLLYHVTVRNLRQNILSAGLMPVREDLYVSRLATRFLSKRLSALVPSVPLFRDIFVTNMEYLLATSG
jgi:SAM-dependent methyltransferase